jgi:Ca2+-binding RTX toxin-like protein
MAKFTSFGFAIKTDELSWPVTIDDLNREAYGDQAYYEVRLSDTLIDFNAFDQDYEDQRTFQASGTFAYTLDETSGDVTAVTGTVNTLSFRQEAGDYYGDDFFVYGWETTGLSLSINDVTAAPSGPSLEALLFSGDDQIYGARYNDSLRGLAGADHLSGNDGRDTLKGGDGNDWLTGGKGNDKLLGEVGDDVLDGGAGKDKLTGNGGRDVFRFNDAPTAVDADTITDFAHGDDKIQFRASPFAAIGARLDKAEFYSKAGATGAHDSSDRVVYDPASGRLYFDKDGVGGASAILLATLTNKAALVRGDFGIIPVFRDVAGNNLTQTFTGPTNISEFYFGDGNDSIVFEVTYPWSDMVAELDLGSGNDSLQTHGGEFNVSAGTGNDTVVGGGTTNVISGGDGNDSLTGGSEDDQIFGGRGNDILTGLGRLEGGEGNDTLQAASPASAYRSVILVGGPGDDLYDVTHQHVLIIEAAGGGDDTVRSTINFYLPNFVQNLTLVGDAAEKAVGNNLDNVLTGNGADNRMRGGSGNDTIDGGAGNDRLEGGNGNDLFLFTSFGDDTADSVQDFRAADDTIALDHTVFLAIKDAGKLTSAQFLANASGLAERSTDRIVYNTTDGELYWDRDGSGTAYDPQHFATLDYIQTIKADDFLMV